MTATSTDVTTPPGVGATLDSWLDWLQTLHPDEIELGLARVSRVANAVGVLPENRDSFPRVIIVGGTNGKGSVVSMLASVYSAAGYRTGSYSSPHIVSFNERVAIDTVPVDDALLTTAFAEIEAVRDVALTYFEYTTLAAAVVFLKQQVDVMILEVGLGGRLDAVNIWDADATVLTNVALDHLDWLGSDREQIGHEKVAIARSGAPMIIADPDPPQSVLNYCADNDIVTYRVGSDYNPVIRASDWQLDISGESMSLPFPALPGEHQIGNAAAACVAIHALQSVLPVPMSACESGLQAVRLAGRFEQRVFKGRDLILDVAHNAAALLVLKQELRRLIDGSERAVQGVIAMMADKDIGQALSELVPLVSRWHCIALPIERALPADELGAQILDLNPDAQVVVHLDSQYAVDQALTDVVVSSEPDAIILVTGSFYTLNAVLPFVDPASG